MRQGFRFLLACALATASTLPGAAETAPASPEAARAEAWIKSATSALEAAREEAASPASAEEELAVSPDEAEEASRQAQSLMRLAETFAKRGDPTSAEVAYQHILDGAAPRPEKTRALLAFGRMLYDTGAYTKAAAVYERFLKTYPDDGEIPHVYLELGRTLRAMGSHRLAVARFYNVLNSTLKLPEAGGDDYRKLARVAQFEIAETHFQAGDYAEAAKFFGRVKLLELSATDRSKAAFKALYSLHLAGGHEETVSAIRQFLLEFPRSPSVPEARYLLSVSLRRLNRQSEALQVALELLRERRTRADESEWMYWQRRTGNQLANEFYEAGDFRSALVIYETLGALSEEPAWRLPALYQAGLCLERLRQPERAVEKYRAILEGSGAGEKPAGESSADLGELAGMAKWRHDHLVWHGSAEARLKAFGPFVAPVEETPGPPEPVPLVESKLVRP